MLNSTSPPWETQLNLMFLNIIASMMMTKQVFSKCQAMKLTFSICNGFHKMRNFPFTFEQYSVLKRICILLQLYVSMYYCIPLCSFHNHCKIMLVKSIVTVKLWKKKFSTGKLINPGDLERSIKTEREYFC